MSLAGNTPYNTRLLNDYNFVATASMGTNLASFNLVQVSPYPVTEKVALTVYANVPSAAQGTASVQDSADNVTFANVTALGSQPISSSGATTSLFVGSWLLPPNIRQYTRVSSSSNTGACGLTSSLNF